VEVSGAGAEIDEGAERAAGGERRVERRPVLAQLRDERARRCQPALEGVGELARQHRVLGEDRRGDRR
jgi:hypothetical protein